MTANLTNINVVCTSLPAIDYAYVLDTTSSMVRQFNVTSNGLAPTSNNQSTGYNPCGIALHPSGKYLYVGNSGAGTISQYGVGTGGVLVPMSPAYVQSGSRVCNITIDPAGTYAYALTATTGQSGPTTQQVALNVYSIGLDGSLTSQPSLGISNIYSAYGSGGSIVFTPNGQFAYLTLPFSSTPYQYSVSSGALTQLNPAVAPAASISSNFGYLSINNQGTYAYISGGYDTVARYGIGTDGKLNILTTVVSGNDAVGPFQVVFDPSGRYAYVVNSMGGYTSIKQFSLNSDGGFSPLNPISISGNWNYGSSKVILSFDPSGKYAFFLTNSGIGQFSVNSDGTLVLISEPSAPLPFSPSSMIVTHL